MGAAVGGTTPIGRRWWGRSRRTRGACTTCTATCGSGWRTAGTRTTRGLREMGRRGRAAGTAVGVWLRGGSWGNSPEVASVRRDSLQATVPGSGARSSVFAWRGRWINFFSKNPYLFPTIWGLGWLSHRTGAGTPSCRRKRPPPRRCWSGRGGGTVRQSRCAVLAAVPVAAAACARAPGRAGARGFADDAATCCRRAAPFQQLALIDARASADRGAQDAAACAGAALPGDGYLNGVDRDREHRDLQPGSASRTARVGAAGGGPEGLGDVRLVGIGWLDWEGSDATSEARRRPADDISGGRGSGRAGGRTGWRWWWGTATYAHIGTSAESGERRVGHDGGARAGSGST